MSIIYQGYQWALGFDNAAGLTPVESDVIRFQGKPFYVHSLGSWDEGIPHTRGDLLTVTTGFQSFVWVADIMSDAQYNYIQTKTPGGSGLSAKLTVRSLTRSGSFANYNAVLTLPKKSGLDRKWSAYRGVPLTFVVWEAL